MKTGLLIVNYNDFDSTKNLLENIRTYSVFSRVLVVDNHSTDDSIKRLRNFRKLRNSFFDILEMKDNLGYSSAINSGSRYLIEQLGCCNIVVSNPDILIEKEEDIWKLLSLLSKKNVGVVGPTVLEGGLLNHGWRNPSPFIDGLMNLPYIHRFIRKRFVHYSDNYYHGESSKVDVISGCFFCISSDTLDKINFLDENVFLYYEENILAKKLQDIGLDSLIHNQVLIVHNHSVSIDKNMKKIKKYCAQKKSQYYFQKTYQHANILDKIFLKTTCFFSKIILSIYYYVKDLAR